MVGSPPDSGEGDDSEVRKEPGIALEETRSRDAMTTAGGAVPDPIVIYRPRSISISILEDEDGDGVLSSPLNSTQIYIALG